jgi:hypothetical protein
VSLAVPASLLVLGVGLGLATVVVALEARRSGLGLAYPAVAWLALHVLFFGIGGAVLAVTQEASGQAAFTGAAAAAFAGGLWLSSRLAAHRGRPAGNAGASQATGDSAPPRPGIEAIGTGTAVLLALGSVALVVPILLRTGLPFLTEDMTGARAEIAGLIVQPMRVALPALAVAWLLRGMRAGRPALVAVVVLVGAMALFDLLLASRYFIAELAGALAIGWLLAGGRVRWRVAALLVVAGVAVFGTMQVLRAYDQAQGRELAFLVERTVNRVILVQPRTLDAIMTAIPADEPFFVGLGWVRRLGPAVGREIPNLGYWIYPRIVGDAQVVAGYAAPGLPGEAWANFGWAGLGLFAILGAAAERLAALIARRSGVADRAAAALLVLFLARTHALGLGGLAVLLAITTGWRFLVASRGGLARDLRAALAWRSPPPG